MIDYQRNNNYDSKLVCQTAPNPSSSQSSYPGGMGVTLIRDNVYSANLASAVPSGSAVYSQLIDAKFLDNQTVGVTVWMKGYLLPAKTSKYDLSFNSNGTGLLYFSTDETPSNKV